MKGQHVNGWTTEPLSAIATFSNGLWKGKKGPFTTAKVLRNTNFRPHGAMSLDDVAEIDVETKQLEKRRLQKGDIILERSGGGPKQPVGRVVLFDLDDGIFSFSNFTSVVRITDKTKVEPAYLHQVLNWWHASGVTEGIQSRSTGIRNLDFKAYKELGVPLPPLEEQRRIVEVLDKAFEGLARARTNAETNLANAREIYANLLEGELNRAEGAYETSLGDHIDLLVGYAFKSKGFTSDSTGMRLLRGDNIIPGGTRWDGVKRWPQSNCAEYEKYNLRANDVVVAMDRTWIKSGIKYAVLSPMDIPCLLVQRVARLRPSPTMLTQFLAALIGSKLFEKYVLSIQTGTGVPHISGSQIQAFPFNLPSLKEQSRITDLLGNAKEKVDKLATEYEAQVQDIDDLRQSLLQKAFAGELT